VSTNSVVVATSCGPLVICSDVGYNLNFKDTSTVPAKFLKSGIKRLIDIKFSPACGITKLPDSIKEEDVKAKYKDGVLRFNLIKKEEAKLHKPKKIEIA
jgi:hypothetical protein